MKLSAQYAAEEADPDLELKVTVYNINTDKGQELLKKCRTLREYTLFVERTREALEGKKSEDEKRAALNKVIDGCINDGILEKLLMERREEIIVFSILNYDQEAHEWALHADGYDEGVADERRNTEAERKRAEKAEADRDRAEAELAEATERIKTLEAKLTALSG